MVLRGIGLLLSLAACADDAPPAAPPLDRTDPVAVARAALEAYKARDYERLGELAVEAERATYSEIAVVGARQARYRALFPDWAIAAARAWGGSLPEVRYLVEEWSPPEARVRFGKGADGRLHLAVLAREKGEWRFKGLLAALPEHYRALQGSLG